MLSQEAHMRKDSANLKLTTCGSVCVKYSTHYKASLLHHAMCCRVLVRADSKTHSSSQNGEDGPLVTFRSMAGKTVCGNILLVIGNLRCLSHDDSRVETSSALVPCCH